MPCDDMRYPAAWAFATGSKMSASDTPAASARASKYLAKCWKRPEADEGL